MKNLLHINKPIISSIHPEFNESDLTFGLNDIWVKISAYDLALNTDYSHYEKDTNNEVLDIIGHLNKIEIRQAKIKEDQNREKLNILVALKSACTSLQSIPLNGHSNNQIDTTIADNFAAYLEHSAPWCVFPKVFFTECVNEALEYFQNTAKKSILKSSPLLAVASYMEFIRPEFRESIYPNYEKLFYKEILNWKKGKDQIGCATFCRTLFEKNVFDEGLIKKTHTGQLNVIGLQQFAFLAFDKIDIKIQLSKKNEMDKRIIRKTTESTVNMKVRLLS